MRLEDGGTYPAPAEGLQGPFPALFCVAWGTRLKNAPDFCPLGLRSAFIGSLACSRPGSSREGSQGARTSPIDRGCLHRPGPASDAEKSAGRRRRRPRAAAAAQPTRAPETAERAPREAAEATRQGRGQRQRQTAAGRAHETPPPAPRSPRAHTTTNKDGDPPNKDGETGREARAGPGEDYGPEPIRAGACRVGGHQRQEGGEPKPPQAGERPTIAGGRRTGGQAAPQGWQRKGPSID